MKQKEITSAIELNNLADRTNVTVKGKVKSSEIKVSIMGGNELAFIQLEDKTGLIDVVALPYCFNQYRDLFSIGNSLIINGLTSISDDNQASVTADTVHLEINNQM